MNTDKKPTANLGLFAGTALAALFFLGSGLAAADDLSLAQAETLLLDNNREIRIARSAAEGAEADNISAGQRPNPQLSVQVSSLSPQLGVGTGGLRDKMMDTVIGVSQLVERGSKREHRMRGGQSRLDAVRQDLADTVRSQRMILRQSYYDLRLAQEKQRIAEETAALYRKTVEAAEQRLRAGDLPASEVARIRVEALRAENDTRQATGDLEKAQSSLAYLIGAERKARSLHAADAWPVLAEATPPVSAEVDERPDVRAALSRVQVAEATRDLAHSLRTRDVTVGLSFDHNPTGTTYAPNSYGVAASIPLFTNYGYEGEIRRAEADLQASREQLEQVRAQASTDIGKALSDLEAARDRARRFEGGLLAEARRAAQAAEFAFKNGAMDVMDLLDARRTLKATQIDAASARADYAKAVAAWTAATATEEFRK